MPSRREVFQQSMKRNEAQAESIWIGAEQCRATLMKEELIFAQIKKQ